MSPFYKWGNSDLEEFNGFQKVKKLNKGGRVELGSNSKALFTM